LNFMSAKMGARRLTAILAADIAGYSALMGENEIDTVAALKGHQSIILPMIAGFEGRIIDTAGDGVLAEFSSVLNAVKCAVAIQETLLERNASVAPDRRMLFRIGINQGDVLFDNDRIFGDGINVAARLEGLCEPGGICISGKVYEEIKSRFQIRYEDLGRQTLKNIAEPVQAYRISVSGAPASKTKQSAKLPLRKSLNRLIGAGAVVATLCAVWLGWSVYMPSRLMQTGPVVPLEAQATADERAWSDAISIRTTQAFTQYLDHFSNGLHVADAQRNLKKADESIWIDAMDIGTIAALNQYLSQFPEGAHVTQAASRIAELQRQAADEKVWSAAVIGGTKEAFNQYVKTLPSGIHVNEAFERLSEIDAKRVAFCKARYPNALSRVPPPETLACNQVVLVLDGTCVPGDIKKVIAGCKEKDISRMTVCVACDISFGRLGVSTQKVTEDMAAGMRLAQARGLLITEVSENGAAKRAGIRPGDVIVMMDGKEIKNLDDLPRIVGETPAGKTVDLVIIRDGKEESLPVFGR
jgi:class 3 adenylate cyclase